MLKVFLSYSQKDETVALKIKNDLDRINFTVWFDNEYIDGGESILVKITEGLKACNFLCLLNSYSASQSNWIKFEIETFLSMKLSGQTEKRIIVLQLDNSAIPDFLSSLSYIDFTSYQRGFDELATSLGYHDIVPNHDNTKISPRIVQAVFDSSLSSSDMYKELKQNVNDEKRIDQKLLYWNVDSAIKWVNICLCSHYPLYHRSIELLLKEFDSGILKKIITEVGIPNTFINMGVGSGQKDYIILRNMLLHAPHVDYIVIDLSLSMLQETIKHVYSLLEENPDKLTAKCIIGDLQHLELYDNIYNSNQMPRIFGFLGSNISNFWENKILDTFHNHLLKKDVIIMEVDWIGNRNEKEIISGYSDDVNQKFIWQPMAFLGYTKPHDWSSRFNFYCTRQYTDVPNSLTVVSEYSTDFGNVILSTSTKYDRQSFLKHIQEHNGFRIIGEFSLNDLFSVLILGRQ